MAVVLARSRQRSLDRDATLLLPAAGAVPALVGGLRLDSSEFAWLADDTLVVVLTAAGAATDLATRAARAALALRAEHPGAALVVATGGAEVGPRCRPGRSSTARRHARRLPAVALPEEAIALDPLTADLLRPARRARDAARGVLAGERPPSPCAARLPFVGASASSPSSPSRRDRGRARRAGRPGDRPGGRGQVAPRAELLSRLRSVEPPEVWSALGDPMSGASPLALVARASAVAGILDGEALARAGEAPRAAVAPRVPAAASG